MWQHLLVKLEQTSPLRRVQSLSETFVVGACDANICDAIVDGKLLIPGGTGLIVFGIISTASCFQGRKHWRGAATADEGDPCDTSIGAAVEGVAMAGL